MCLLNIFSATGSIVKLHTVSILYEYDVDKVQGRDSFAKALNKVHKTAVNICYNDMSITLII